MPNPNLQPIQDGDRLWFENLVNLDQAAQEWLFDNAGLCGDFLYLAVETDLPASCPAAIVKTVEAARRLGTKWMTFGHSPSGNLPTGPLH